GRLGPYWGVRESPEDEVALADLGDAETLVRILPAFGRLQCQRFRRRSGGGPEYDNGSPARQSRARRRVRVRLPGQPTRRGDPLDEVERSRCGPSRRRTNSEKSRCGCGGSSSVCYSRRLTYTESSPFRQAESSQLAEFPISRLASPSTIFVLSIPL